MGGSALGALDGGSTLVIDDEGQEIDRVAEAAARLQALLEEERERNRVLLTHVSQIDAFIKVSGMNKDLPPDLNE